MNQWVNSSMLLYTTEKCNMKCSYCYNDTNIDKAKMSDLDEYNNLKTFINHIVDNWLVDKIMVSWWEPFIWPNLEKFLSDFKWKKKIVIFTNGTHIKNKIWLLEWWIEVKISLHWLVSTNRGVRYYKNIIASLEDKNINYGLIYLISKQNYNRFFEDYKLLRESSQSNNFSLKFQPIIIPKSNTKYIRWDKPIEITPKNNKTFEEHSLHSLTESDWEVFRQNILHVIDYEKEYSQSLLSSKNEEPVYVLWDKSLEYHERLRDFYLKGKKVHECNTWPMIIVWSDWDLHQCMFLFNKSIWNIHNLVTEESRNEVLKILASKNFDYIKNAKCFSEECLWAMRPM